MHGLLLAGAFELVFQDGTPGPAVVTAYVDLAKKLVRPGAGGLANASLRKLAGWREDARLVETQEVGPAIVPLAGGRSLVFPGPVLPDPAVDRVGYGSAAFSLSRALVKRWFGRFKEDAWSLMAQSLEQPALIVSGLGSEAASVAEVVPHDREGFWVYRGAMSELAGLLARGMGPRVQDPTAAEAVASTADLRPGRILDLCAGRGTKSVQALALHPEAELFAYEPHAERAASLQELAGVEPRLKVVRDEELDAGSFDLVLADVPCTNAGVLARRLEARYRFGHRSLDDVRGLQKRILGRAFELVTPGGCVLYSTCSLEPEENEQQVQRLIRKKPARLLDQRLTLPGGRGVSYHDGGFIARIERVS